MIDIQIRARQFYHIQHPYSGLGKDYVLSYDWLQYARRRDLKTPLPLDLHHWHPLRPAGHWIWNGWRLDGEHDDAHT